MKRTPEEIDQEQAEAWVGDAVLALFVREWLLKNRGRVTFDVSSADTDRALGSFEAAVGGPCPEKRRQEKPG